MTEYAKSAGLAGHVQRKCQMSDEGVNSRRRVEIEENVRHRNYMSVDISKVPLKYQPKVFFSFFHVWRNPKMSVGELMVCRTKSFCVLCSDMVLLSFANPRPFLFIFMPLPWSRTFIPYNYSCRITSTVSSLMVYHHKSLVTSIHDFYSKDKILGVFGKRCKY